MLWVRFWTEERWGEAAEATNEVEKGRRPASCFWRWNARRALFEGLKGIIVYDSQARKTEGRVV